MLLYWQSIDLFFQIVLVRQKIISDFLKLYRLVRTFTMFLLFNKL